MTSRPFQWAVRDKLEPTEQQVHGKHWRSGTSCGGRIAGQGNCTQHGLEQHALLVAQRLALPRTLGLGPAQSRVKHLQGSVPAEGSSHTC